MAAVLLRGRALIVNLTVPLQEHEANRFAVVFSYDGFAPGEPLRRDGWTFGSSGQSPAQRPVTGTRRLLYRLDGFNLVLSERSKKRRFGAHLRILSGTALPEIGPRCQSAAFSRRTREADIGDRRRGGRGWAESAPIRVAWRRTGVLPIAVIPCQARNRVHRPRRSYASCDSSTCVSTISGISGVGEKPSSAGARTAWASAGRPVDW
jgi:hypothetical protein